jgi:hypothetical protein
LLCNILAGAIEKLEFMKLQKTTWLLVVIAMLFGGVIYFLEIQKQPQ